MMKYLYLKIGRFIKKNRMFLIKIETFFQLSCVLLITCLILRLSYPTCVPLLLLSYPTFFTPTFVSSDVCPIRRLSLRRLS